MYAQFLFLAVALGAAPVSDGSSGMFSIPGNSIPRPIGPLRVSSHDLWSPRAQNERWPEGHVHWWQISRTEKHRARKPWSRDASDSWQLAPDVRAQNVPYDEEPETSPDTATPPTETITPYAAPYDNCWTSPFSQPVPQDPFLGVPGLNSPNFSLPPGNTFGAVGPQPFRFGWTSRVDFGGLPKESVRGAPGDFGVFETDIELKYTAPVAPGIILSTTPQFNYRSWDGPSLDPATGRSTLPGSVYRLGLDFLWQTPANALWSAQLGFNPSVNSDFNGSLTRDAWNWDGRGALIYRPSAQWMLVGGIEYLDRVHDRVIPNAGVVFTPNDRWEYRILFPEARISLFLGNPYGYAQWLYLKGEYHIEAYQIKENRRDQVELEDYRMLFGLRSEMAGLATHIEMGWVFSRDVDFASSSAAGFDPQTGFIILGGWQY